MFPPAHSSALSSPDESPEINQGIRGDRNQVIGQAINSNIINLSVGTDTCKELMDEIPLNFNSLIEEKTKWFVGRKYVFDSIQNFINKNNKGYFTIIGDPGQGKSAILAKYVQDTGCVAYFNDQLKGINRSDQFLENVCRQLVIRYKLPYNPLPSRANQDSAFLGQLLEEAASKSGGQPVVIAVDALDEVDAASFRDANLLYLPSQLPEGVYFILTRRRIDVPLTFYAPKDSLNLLDQKFNFDTESDVRQYIQNRVDDSETLQQRINERQESILDFINKLTAKSEINFMYLRYILLDIESGLYKDLDLERFPHGLQEYYEFHWRRMGMMSQPLPTDKIKIVYILAEVRQPVSVKKICDFSSENGSKVEEVIKEWKQFLHNQLRNGQILYSVYHSSFKDFFHRQDILALHPITLQGVHRSIAEDQLSFWERFKAAKRCDRS